jgi:hypothetical protein
MINIQPQYLPLSKLLIGRLFRIPEYQRSYSWTWHERNDLFDDILRTHSKGQDGGHFMAAIVCLRRENETLGTDEFHVMEVVDGQQRITTIIILLNAIKLQLDKKNKTEEKLLRELSELLVKVEGDELLLLQTNHDTSHYFTNYLRKGIAPSSDVAETIADKEVLEAIENCNRFITQWKEDGETLATLAALLKNRLFFLLHEIDDEKTVYTVFEVLNSRGLEVAWLDRLKSILMGNAFELKQANRPGVIRDLHTAWGDIYRALGLQEGLDKEALRFAATLRMGYAPSKLLSEQDSVEALRKNATTAKGIREVASWLLRVTKACNVVTSQRRLEAITRISQARLLAIAIHLRDDISDKDRQKLLSRWEKVSFRTYGMLPNDARTGVGDYIRVAWDTVNSNSSVKEIENAIRTLGAYYPIEEAVASLRIRNCYDGWQSELRYFMFRYEEHLSKKQRLNFSNEQWEKIWLESPSDSIEHIWAQSTAPEKCRHNLGNLLLLPPNLNSTLYNIKPRHKADAYRKTGLLIAGEVADTLENGRWSGKAIAEREDALLDWAATEWAD